MAQHGYAREYDEDFDRREDRERGWRDRAWQDREWRDDERSRDRGFMFGDEERERLRRERSGRQVNRDWPQREGESYGREHGFGGYQGDYRGGWEQGGFGGAGDWNEGRRNFSSHPDEHYRSWRRKQIDALDRDYADYCREREQQFHSDFDTWRSQRQANPQPLRTGMTQTGLSADPTGMTQARTETAPGGSEGETDPMGTATLGTTSRGRGQK